MSGLTPLRVLFSSRLPAIAGIERHDGTYDIFGKNPNVPHWDRCVWITIPLQFSTRDLRASTLGLLAVRSVSHVEWMATIFQFAFFMGAIVILMNLLIAMMADTYTSVIANAVAECTP